MKKGDIQKGKPQVVFTDTKTNIEALSGVVEGAHAYATDTNEPGWNDGASWIWGAGSGSGGGSSIADPVFHVEGVLVATTDVNGVYICPRSGTILYVYIYCRDPGSASSTIVDVNLNGTTIFTTQGNRPTLAWDDANQVAKSGAPDTVAVVENDILSIDIDQIATGAKDLTVVVALDVGGAGDITYAALQACQLINEIKGWPPVVNAGDLDALNLWWDKLGTPSTAPTVVAVSGEGITEDFELAMKVVADGANEGLFQRFTYADEPRVKAGRKLSSLWAIWCVGGVGVTLSLLNQTAEETAASKVTAAAWTIVEVANHTLAGTYVDVILKTDGAGTFYAVPLGANIGSRGFPLHPRPTRCVNSFSANVVSGVDPGGADWTDADFTAVSSPLTFMCHVLILYKNDTTAAANVLLRRNGDAGAGAAVVTSVTTAVTYRAHFPMLVDDGQIMEYKTGRPAGDAETVSIALRDYWEWG